MGADQKTNEIKRVVTLFDFVYQGFASGSLNADTQSVWMFVADGGKSFAAQNYAKNMKLYAGRVGALSIVCKTEDVASTVKSQLKLLEAMADQIINMRKQLLEVPQGRGTPGD
ncbi:hypothetical protein R6Q59_020977 [Mikania micrantha]